MPRMIDLIRASAVPANLVQSAARGALSIPSDEMIEILVHLATKNKLFAEQAQLTLAGWDKAATRAAAGNSRTPKEVLEYFIDPENLRPSLLPALLENPSTPEKGIVKLAESGSRAVAEVMLQSQRVSRSRTILESLGTNANLTEAQVSEVKEKASLLETEPEPQVGPAAESGSSPVVEATASAAPMPENAGEVEAPDEAVSAFMTEHAAEISADAGKKFEPVGGIYQEFHTEGGETEAEGVGDGSTAESESGTAAAARRAPKKKSFLGAGHEKGTALQKIAKLDVKGRIQLAMKGDKEERSLLIRDGTKIVALAVLDSPKITDGEVEKFAGQKNVLEAVLRAIPMRRRFMKIYPVVRNLTFNPRTPIDVSLGLMKHLQTQDLRALAGNKDVSDTVRKLALKMFRTRLDPSKGA